MITMDRSIGSVDEYLAECPPEIRTALSALRTTIKRAAPGAEERISYGIPAYMLNGPLVFFAAQKNHLSLYVVNKNILNDYRGELKHFKTSGTTIHFYPDTPLPPALVKNIVKQRVVENALLSTGSTKAAKGRRTNVLPLPEKLGRPAERALAAAGISSLTDLTSLSLRQIAELHGVGPTAVKKLSDAMKKARLKFRS